MESIELAAHVDHKVTHASSTAKVALGITGAMIGIGISTMVTGGGTIAVIAAAGAYGGAGLDLGKMVDKFLAPSPAGKLVSGFPTVLLGPDTKQAARADAEDTKADCDKTLVAEGSKIVMLGEEAKPMSRRQDRLKCGGMISEGIRTIFVGGEASMKGEPINEEDRLAVKALSAAFGIAGAIKSFGKRTVADSLRGAAKLGATGLEATGHKDAANALKATTMTKPKFAPKDLIDAYGTGKTGVKAGSTGIDIGRAIVSH